MFYNPHVDSLEAYVPGEQPRDGSVLIKLNTNENPYPPSPLAIEAIQRAAGEQVRLYPDAESTALREAIAQVYGVSPQEVFVGNGSDEVLAFCFQGLFNPAAPVLFPDITYGLYPIYSKLYQLPVETVALEEDFHIPVEALCQRRAGGVILPNPNAPTSLALDIDAIGQIAAAQPCAVVIDEAYSAFSGQTALELVRRYPNLLLTFTMSKSHALAGLRVGFAIGQAPLIEVLGRVKNSFNSYPLDRLAQAGARAAVLDTPYTDEICGRVVRTREETAARLAAMGFVFPKPAGNFIFARHPGFSGVHLLNALRAQGILVRHFNSARIDDYLRISIGTDGQMDRVTAALKEIVCP